VAEAEWKTVRASYWPKFDVGYTFQSVDGRSGFYSWQAGISIPLLFFSQAGKTKAAKINYGIAGYNFDQKRLRLKAEYNQQMKRYLALDELINYYQKEALPLAREQIDAANLAYRLGGIDYIQFIQNVESAINTNREYLKQQTEYYVLSAQLKYITGE